VTRSELAARCDRAASGLSDTILISSCLVHEDGFRETASVKICSFTWENELGRTLSEFLKKSENPKNRESGLILGQADFCGQTLRGRACSRAGRTGKRARSTDKKRTEFRAYRFSLTPCHSRCSLVHLLRALLRSLPKKLHEERMRD
jgi:hypothetical protein